ncbi:hypothetical protein NGRA_1007 [Nosema granulosis]|uniref:Uncharacterized protein n=1 Tax=Nosema granulosis TaxID=83296 RepID=A0A9P6H0B2_9MICR|nr:hypothetical protein NGRA_1007 [Nosema granulosis]
MFIENLEKLKKSKDREEAMQLIRMNDYNLEYEKIEGSRLREYMRVRRSVLKRYPPTKVEAHIEALRRKESLRGIKEEAQKLVSVNRYIRFLLEEKKEPLDTLVDNLEYSEIYTGEANKNLEEERRRRMRCKSLKTVGKIILFGLLLIAFLKIGFIIIN